MPRIIIHVDMDAFFASIEVLDRPELRGKPVIVGGGVTRGVVSAASYEARKFGVHSAMPMAQALRLCPQGVVIAGRMGRYSDVSDRIMAIFGRYTPLLEPVSLDEAYLDLTSFMPEGQSPEALARAMQREVLQATQLTCSLGIATGKAVAKMASDLRKPNGIVVVPPGEEAAFLAPLPIGALRGVGEVTERKLRALGIRTVGDLVRLSDAGMRETFGSHGRDLLALAQGYDDSPVVPERQAKSLGRETTFLTDVTDRDTLERTLLWLSESVATRLRKHGLLAKGVTLKVRYGDFTTFTRAHSLAVPTDVTDGLYHAALILFHAIPNRRPVRLIGVTAGPLTDTADVQLRLFDEQHIDKRRQVERTIDAIRERFGKDAVIRARLAKKDGEE